MSRPFLERQNDGYHWYAIDDGGQIIYSSPDMSREVRDRFFHLDALDPRDEIDEERGADWYYANGLNEEHRRLNLTRWRIRHEKADRADLEHVLSLLQQAEPKLSIPYLLTLLGEAHAPEYEVAVARFLDDWEEHSDATTALQVLAKWGLFEKYQERAVGFMLGVPRDMDHELQLWTCAHVSWWLSGEDRGGVVPPLVPPRSRQRLLEAFLHLAEGLDESDVRFLGIVSNLATAVGFGVGDTHLLAPARVFARARQVIRELPDP